MSTKISEHDEGWTRIVWDGWTFFYKRDFVRDARRIKISVQGMHSPPVKAYQAVIRSLKRSHSGQITTRKSKHPF